MHNPLVKSAFHATTSAELKLLLRRRTFRSPGRADLFAGTTTAAVLFVIHASDDDMPDCLVVGVEISFRVDPERFNVGRREGVGDPAILRLTGVGAGTGTGLAF